MCHLFSIFLFFTKVPTDKRASRKETDANHQIRAVGDEINKTQAVNYGTAMTSTNNLIPSTPMRPQPKIDATDRRQIEAQNEDKAHTTKEEFDDIRDTYKKEKKKKEEKVMEQCQPGIATEGSVSKTFTLII